MEREREKINSSALYLIEIDSIQMSIIHAAVWIICYMYLCTTLHFVVKKQSHFLYDIISNSWRHATVLMTSHFAVTTAVCLIPYDSEEYGMKKEKRKINQYLLNVCLMSLALQY